LRRISSGAPGTALLRAPPPLQPRQHNAGQVRIGREIRPVLFRLTPKLLNCLLHIVETLVDLIKPDLTTTFGRRGECPIEEWC
jgi:hypothetical protein